MGVQGRPLEMAIILKILYYRVNALPTKSDTPVYNKIWDNILTFLQYKVFGILYQYYYN